VGLFVAHGAARRLMTFRIGTQPLKNDHS